MARTPSRTSENLAERFSDPPRNPRHRTRTRAVRSVRSQRNPPMAKQFYGEAANFPGAPENFDPSDPLADKVAAIAQREHVVREKMVKIETAKVSARGDA